MRIDHVIVATGDLDATERLVLDRWGLGTSGGGRHDGLGTHNRIVALGGGYLELLAIADRAEAAESDLGRAVSRFVERYGSGLMTWVVAVEAIDPFAARLGTTITTIRRTGLAARLTGVAEAIANPVLPFFIERDAASADPGAAGSAGGITAIELAGEASRLADWLGPDAGLPVEVRAGAAAVDAVGIGGRVLRWPPAARSA